MLSPLMSSSGVASTALEVVAEGPSTPALPSVVGFSPPPTGDETGRRRLHDVTLLKRGWAV
jgi:hypothetical protein